MTDNTIQLDLEMCERIEDEVKEFSKRYIFDDDFGVTEVGCAFHKLSAFFFACSLKIAANIAKEVPDELDMNYIYTEFKKEFFKYVNIYINGRNEVH